MSGFRIIPLHKMTDLDLLHSGLVSLAHLEREGPVVADIGAMLRCRGSRDPATGIRADHHEWSEPMEEDGETYVRCNLCGVVRLSPYVRVNGVEVSRKPLPKVGP